MKYDENDESLRTERRERGVQFTTAVLGYETQEEDYATRLRVVRLMAKISQKEMAKILGVSKTTYTKYENFHFEETFYVHVFQYKNYKEIKGGPMPVHLVIKFINHFKDMELFANTSLPNYIMLGKWK